MPNPCLFQPYLLRLTLRFELFAATQYPSLSYVTDLLSDIDCGQGDFARARLTCIYDPALIGVMPLLYATK
jgi:hypothetical protein